MNTQLYYRRGKEDHSFFAGDKMSTGVMVKDKDFKTAFEKAETSLSQVLQKNYKISGSVRCDMNVDDLEKWLSSMPQACVLWHIEEWR